MLYSRIELTHILKEDYPDAVVMSEEAILEVHRHSKLVTELIQDFHTAGLTYVAYYLPDHAYGAREGWCCNGLRFGPGGNYISLPQVKANPVDLQVQA